MSFRPPKVHSIRQRDLVRHLYYRRLLQTFGNPNQVCVSYSSIGQWRSRIS